jgi:hypothetical protein
MFSAVSGKRVDRDIGRSVQSVDIGDKEGSNREFGFIDT